MRTRSMRRQDTNGKNDAVARALGGARWVALGALLAKVASMACTQIVLRLAPVEVLGVASARLELVMNGLLCVTRDGARLALTRCTTAPSGPRGPSPGPRR